MNEQMRWLSLVMALVVGIAGSMGCATMAATSAVKSGDADFYFKPVLSDEIVAIGRPDATLAQQLGQSNAVAFIGLKHTYLLHKGGEELERIAQLKLDGKRLDIDAARSHKLYRKDQQVWGELTLTYGSIMTVTAEEQAELEKAGFNAMKGGRNNPYQKKILIEGVIYPAIKIPDDVNSRLTTRRPFNLYNPRDAKPPVMGKILKAPLIAVGVAADVALLPVYAVITGLVLVIGITAH